MWLVSIGCDGIRRAVNSEIVSADEVFGSSHSDHCDVATLPVAVVKDIYTLGRNRDGPRAYTVEKLKADQGRGV